MTWRKHLRNRLRIEIPKSVTGDSDDRTVPCHISSHSHNPCFYQKWVKNGWFLVDVEIFIYLCHILLQSPRLWRTQDIGLIRKLIKGTVPVISLWSSLPNLLLPRHISVSAAPSAWLPHDEKSPLCVQRSIFSMKMPPLRAQRLYHIVYHGLKTSKFFCPIHVKTSKSYLFWNFHSILPHNLRKNCTFASLYSRRADFARCRSGYREGALHFENASLTLCFWLFETTTIELVVENIAEVGAAGGYIYRPVGVQRTNHVLTHALRASIIYQRRGYRSVCLQPRLW